MDRHTWAVGVLDPRPGEHLLEVGGGPGVSTALICERLAGSGRLLAVDRSATAVRRAAARTGGSGGSGVLELRQAALADLDLPAGSLDGVLAVNVNLFWTGPAAREWTLLHRALRPGGRVALCWGYGEQRSPTPPGRVTDAVGRAAAAHGFAPPGVDLSGAGLALLLRR